MSTALAWRRPPAAMRRPRRLLGGLGLLLLLAAAWLAWRTLAAPAPYRYVEAAPSHAASAPTLHQFNLVDAEGGKVLAEADVAAAAQGPVLLGWRAQVDDPLLYLTVPADEAQRLAAVLARHRTPEGVLLAWWDSSRQLRHGGAGEVFFDRHLGVPLFVPERWRAQQRRVAQAEQAFWGEAGDAAQRAAFGVFTRALASPENEGVALLRSLAPGRNLIVVLHLRDLLLLGQVHPDRVAVSFRDFADSGDVHRSVRGVQGWLRETGQAAYGVLKLPGNRLRVIALQDAAGADTLAARLLPVIGNRQEDVAGMTLVFRSDGFVVYELAAADPAR